MKCFKVLEHSYTEVYTHANGPSLAVAAVMKFTSPTFSSLSSGELKPPCLFVERPSRHLSCHFLENVL